MPSRVCDLPRVVPRRDTNDGLSPAEPNTAVVYAYVHT